MHKIKCSLHWVLKWIFPFFLVLVFSIFSSSLHAQDKAEDIIDIAKKFDEMFAKKDKKQKGDWVKKFKLASKFLQDGEKKRRKFTLEVGLGFNGNKAFNEKNEESEKDSLYKLDISGAISKGGYPREFRFKVATSVQYKGGILQEAVKKMSVNYDYYILPWLNTYGFVENFSNTYLNIAQRYEIGFGLQCAAEIGMTGKVAKGLKDYKEVFECNKEFWNIVNKLESEISAEKKKVLCKQFNALKKGGEIVEEYLKKKNATFRIGLALSLFYELEHASYKGKFDRIDEETGKKTEVTRTMHKNDQLIRVSLRPSVTVRPIDYLSIYGKIDWKMNTKKMTDYRTEGLLGVKLDLPSLNAAWSEKMSLVFEYLHYSDTDPQKFIWRETNEDKTRGKHEVFQFKLNVKF